MLVLDTEKTRQFFETLDVLGPSHSHKIIRFVEEILVNTELLEVRVKRLEKRKNELEKRVLDDDVYGDEEETDETQGSVLGRD